jgi:hypothetical protein
MFASCLYDVDGWAEVRERGRGGLEGGGWVGEVELQRCSRELFTLPGPWGRSCEVCAGAASFRAPVRSWR